MLQYIFFSFGMTCVEPCATTTTPCSVEDNLLYNIFYLQTVQGISNKFLTCGPQTSPVILLRLYVDTFFSPLHKESCFSFFTGKHVLKKKHNNKLSCAQLMAVDDSSYPCLRLRLNVLFRRLMRVAEAGRIYCAHTWGITQRAQTLLMRSCIKKKQKQKNNS